ncbi:RNA polymerase II C-terminal domain phosphatase-like 4 isoform X4 [Manihot esculenta]|nr:RNA polymerase II C-terminal domain phosphatase-like 4 isoform X4 [Manihot esculenta]
MSAETAGSPVGDNPSLSPVGDISFDGNSLQMSLMTDSPVHSSSSDDFAAFLDAELDSKSSDSSPNEEGAKNEFDSDSSDSSLNEEAENDSDSKSKRIKGSRVETLENVEDPKESTSNITHRIKRSRVEAWENIEDPKGSMSNGSLEQNLVASSSKETCLHPGSFGDMCILCGQKLNLETGVTFGYIHKGLRLGNDEIMRLRKTDMKNLLRHKKLYLVLDLDHTLLNSTQLMHMTSEEEYLKSQIDSLQDVSNGSLFMLDFMHMMTKLRPFVRTFLKEASQMFEMYIYTMGDRAYALEMAKLLDPRREYFNARVISRDDGTQRNQKGLDIVLGQESAVLILDDTETELVDNLDGRDVREVLKTVRKDVLKGCKIVFSRVFPTQFQADNHHLWKTAEQLGATCFRELDPSVTHVVSQEAGTEKSRWALKNNKFLVHPRWIEAANYLWQRQPEENFRVNQPKN